MGARIERVHVYHGFSPELAHALARPVREALPDREVVVWARESELRAGLPEVEALLAFRPPKGIWAGARRLRFIQMMGAGVDALLPAPDLPPHVRIANARGIHGPHMSEFALALLLALAKRIPHALEQQRAHVWKPYGMAQLEGRTLGILGLGAIGARELGWLRPTALLVDLARGGIVDETALAEALRARKLAGAALDVFAEEPLPPSSPLWDAPNLILTPHVAGLSPDYMNRLAEIVVENLARVEADRPLVNPVDRARGY